MDVRSEDRRPFPGIGTDPQSVRGRVEAMERLLERAVPIPGTNRKVGLDVILDLVPVAGSTAAAILGAYMAWEARNLGMSKWQMTRMAGNIGVDWLLGLIPWVGAIPDFFFQSNTRNLRIIKRHLDKHHAGTATIDVKPSDPSAPPDGFIAENGRDQLMVLWLDGVPVVAVPALDRRFVIGPLAGRYTAQWRTFLGDRIDEPTVVELPGILRSVPPKGADAGRKPQRDAV